jgi:hypothetical protein
MNLVGLLFELKPLLADPEANFGRIASLLERHQSLAEYEVARFYVGRHFLAPLDRLLHSVDPRERLRGVRLVPLLCARAQAARYLRHVVKDPDYVVAKAARLAAQTLGLADVSPPNARVKPPRARGPNVMGGWNPTGWLYGVHGAADDEKKQPPAEGLPKLRSKDDVARLAGVEAEDLPRLMRPGTGAGSGYVEFEIPKRSGGARRISAPRKKLKGAQRSILDKLLSHMPAHPAAHGFIEGRSTVSNAAPHVGSRVVVRVDIRDFFPTVHYRRVKGLFEAYGYDADVASALAGLTTHRAKLPDGSVAWPGALPQGAPTSPALANLVCRRLDARLASLSAKVGATYTRYADDLTFSFREPPKRLGRFLWWVNAILQQEGFAENVPKRRVMRKGGPMRVTGLAVDARVSIPREERRRFKAILANCRHHGVASQARGNPDFPSWLRGYAAFVRMVHPELGEKWQREVEELLAR